MSYFADDGTGFNLVISGIRANASMVGDDEDIMVNVLVGEERGQHCSPLKARGRDDRAGQSRQTAAGGLQCSDADAEASTAKTATITIQESKDFSGRHQIDDALLPE